MIHYPAVAGMFYPDDVEELRVMLADFFREASDKANFPIPKAIIAPHAGFIYSGPIAASAYACLAKAVEITRVVILAPSHRKYFTGISSTCYDYFETPLGKISVDKESVNTVLTLPFVQVLEEVFSGEHALEVQLPFLQVTLKKFSLVPFLVGDIEPENIAILLEKLWGGSETLIVVSSDLSHYHKYLLAKELDQNTANAITSLDFKAITSEDACGSVGIKGLLVAAYKKQLQARLIDLRNSGDTAGPKNEVVGYGAFHFM